MFKDVRLRDPFITERLGSDLKFPVAGSFEPISGVDLLLQDIQQLLLTIPGERVYNPEFGCNLRTQLWENIDTGAANGAASIRASLDRFEPRITVTNVTYTINRNTDLVTYSIKFIINAIDRELNLIFPFRAGTELSFT